jgi:hypothetical protein
MAVLVTVLVPAAAITTTSLVYSKQIPNNNFKIKAKHTYFISSMLFSL